MNSQLMLPGQTDFDQLEAFAADGLELTPREHQVAAMLAYGFSDDRILADHLRISRKNVQAIVHTLKHKNGWQTRSQIARAYAQAADLENRPVLLRDVIKKSRANGASMRQKEQVNMKVEKVLSEVLQVETDGVSPPPPMNGKWTPLLQLLDEQRAGKWVRVKFTGRKSAVNARAAVNKFFKDRPERVEMRGCAAEGDAFWLYCRKLARKK